MSLNEWPELFVRTVGEAEIRREGYLVHVTHDGKLACKACGKFLPWENPEKHFGIHIRELDDFLYKQGKKTKETRKTNLAKARAKKREIRLKDYSAEEQELLKELVL